MEKMVSLRAHHGMCIAFFQGKGYSDDFTAHMGSVIRRLKENPLIQISAQTDEICSKCPNNKQGICRTQDRVSDYDREVLLRCGLSEGMVLPFADFEKAVYQNILLCGSREDICGKCQWNNLCRIPEKLLEEPEDKRTAVK